MGGQTSFEGGMRSAERGILDSLVGSAVYQGKLVRFSLIDEAQRRAVEFTQFGLTRFVAGEFDQVAALEEFAKALFLIGREQGGTSQFVQEFLGRAFGGSELKPFLEVGADDVGNRDAKGLWIGDQR